MLKLSSKLRIGLRQSQFICAQCRGNATQTPQPLLAKLRTDLKTAMKAKDTSRLNVLRAVLAEITNAAKTPKPIATDLQLLPLLRKRAAAAREAGDEFKAAGRDDLVEKETEQASILEAYASEVETLGESDILQAVQKTIDEVKAQAEKVAMGDILKRVFAPGGSLDGKAVERSEVARIVKRVLGQ